MVSYTCVGCGLPLALRAKFDSGRAAELFRGRDGEYRPPRGCELRMDSYGDPLRAVATRISATSSRMGLRRPACRYASIPAVLDFAKRRAVAA